MSTPNDHVCRFLDDYIAISSAPGFAVMLKGPWGTGKTWFIKNYMASRKNGDTNFIYASLFGLQHPAAVYAELFFATRKTLPSKYARTTAHLVTNIMRNKWGIDSGLIAESVFDHYITNDADVLVLDDLERCALPSLQLLGIINRCVEHKNLKVILIANEDKLSAKITSETGNDYCQQIEKIVGQTLRVSPDFESALTQFLARPSLLRLSPFLITCKDVIAEIFHGSASDNLRVLDKSLWSYGRLCGALPADMLTNPKFMRHLLTNYLIYNMAVVCESVIPEDLAAINSSADLIHLIEGENTDSEDTKLAGILKRYRELRPDTTLLDISDWIVFLRDGTLNKDRIADALRHCPYSSAETIEKWIQLWHYRDLSDEDFILIRDAVICDLQDYRMDDTYAVMQAAGILITLAGMGLAGYTADEIADIVKPSIDHAVRAQCNSIEKLYGYHPDEWFSYRGLGYAAMHTTQMRSLVNYVGEIKKQLREECLPSAAETLLSMMASDPQQFYRMITLGHGGESLFYNIPVFSCVIAEQFVNYLKLLPPENRWMVSSAFRSRYENLSTKSELIEEEQWLVRVVAAIRSHEPASPPLLSEILLHAFADKTFAPAIEQLHALHTPPPDQSESNAG